MENEKQYLNVNRLINELFDIYKSVRDARLNDDNYDFLMEEFDDDYLNLYAQTMAHMFNKEMCKYLNGGDHTIFGSWNNIDYDYPEHIIGRFQYNRAIVDNMVARLNAGEESQQANDDRDWLVDWFWNTFGSSGIEYNFADEVSDMEYIFEQEYSYD